jgi:processive 1,2-diacylglycerol beta-glucosyltransferase
VIENEKLGNVLILTASTGQGHNAAADSLKKELEASGYNVVKIEPYKEMGTSVDAFMADGYKLLATKMPRLYGTLYKLTNYDTLSTKISKILMKSVAKTVQELCEVYKPDLIISTHPLLVGGVASLKEEGLIDLPFISVITDLLPHMAYVDKLYVDAYITGTQQTADELINRGIESEKIHVYGIPIKREFENKTISESFSKDSRFTILLMGGSMGLSSMKKAFKHIMNVDRTLKLIAVCGNNESLKESLEKKVVLITEQGLNNKTVEILGFTNNIAELMDISDVIITKPGGITVSEALTKKIPMIIPFYIPGQEEENTEVLLEAGAAIEVDVKDMEEKIAYLIDNPEELIKMKESIGKVTRTHSLDNTVSLAISLITKYNERK